MTDLPPTFSFLCIHVKPGFELASSGRFVGAPSSRCPATMSWNFAPRGCTQHARAACTRCPEWIPPWWWCTTLPRATAVLLLPLEGSPPCPQGREATLRLASQRSSGAMVAMQKRKMERLQALILRSFREGRFTHRLSHRHMHVANVYTCMIHCTYKRCTDVC